MDLLKKTMDSEVPDVVEQAYRQKGHDLRSTPTRRSRMVGFTKENHGF